MDGYPAEGRRVDRRRGSEQPRVVRGSSHADALLSALLPLFLVLLPAALAVRFLFIFVGPFFIRPDEVFQVLEPAHRLLTGHGAITWEWHAGIRSWLLPGLVAALMAASAGLGLGHSVLAVQGVFATLSLAVVVCAAWCGLLLAGRRGALFCGALTAFWPDTVLDGAHTLTETQGGNLLAIGTLLATVAVRRPRHATRLPFAIGLLLGVAAAIRFQLLPGVLVVLAAATWHDRDRLAKPMLLGFVLPIAGQAVLDWVTLGTPLQSMWKNVVVNLGDRRAALFGTASPVFYLSWFVQLWGAALLPIAFCFVAGFGTAPLAGLVAIAVLLSHSVIAHKEWSFVAGAIPLVLVVAGIGGARLLDRLDPSGDRRVFRMPLERLAVLAIVAVSLATVFSGYKPMRRDHANAPLLMRAARATPGLCGVALLVGDEPWWDWTGGESLLDRDVPLYLLRTPADLASASSGFDVLLAPQAVLAYLPPAYDVSRCVRGLCLLHRAGRCAPNHADLIEDAVNLGLPLVPGSVRQQR